MAMQCLAVALGGAVGAVGRYLLGLAPILHRGDFPFATLLINLIGAFVIGLVAEAAAEKGVQNEHLVLFLKVGVCGGFTTFSTFSLETVALLSGGKTALGMLYILLSVALCLLGVLLGKWLFTKLA